MNWELSFIIWLQQFDLSWPATIFSLLGDPIFFMLLLPGLYWLLKSQRTGRVLLLSFAVAVYVNWALKLSLAVPRPFEVDLRILNLGGGDSYGPSMPSGHAQLAVAVWGYLAWRYRRRWLTVLTGVLLVLLPLARVYQGLHFPLDVLVGYLVGAAGLGATLWLEPRVAAWRWSQQVAGYVGLSLALALGNLVFQHSSVVIATSLFIAAGAGFLVAARWLPYQPPQSWGQRGLCYLLGTGGVVLLAQALPGALALVYGLVGFWVSVQWPATWWSLSWLFRNRLAGAWRKALR